VPHKYALFGASGGEGVSCRAVGGANGGASGSFGGGADNGDGGRAGGKADSGRKGANWPVAATKECWVINPGISPKVIVKRIREGSAAVAAADTAAPQEIQAGEPLPGLRPIPAAGRAAAETKTSPLAAAPRSAVSAAAAQGKRKASTGVAEGSQKRKKSSPVKNCLISKYLIMSMHLINVQMY
jgi:hypothetical protein